MQAIKPLGNALRRHAVVQVRTNTHAAMLNETQRSVWEMTKAFADQELVPNAARLDAEHASAWPGAWWAAKRNGAAPP